MLTLSSVRAQTRSKLSNRLIDACIFCVFGHDVRPRVEASLNWYLCHLMPESTLCKTSLLYQSHWSLHLVLYVHNIQKTEQRRTMQRMGLLSPAVTLHLYSPIQSCITNTNCCSQVIAGICMSSICVAGNQGQNTQGTDSDIRQMADVNTTMNEPMICHEAWNDAVRKAVIPLHSGAEQSDQPRAPVHRTEATCWLEVNGRHVSCTLGWKSDWIVMLAIECNDYRSRLAYLATCRSSNRSETLTRQTSATLLSIWDLIWGLAASNPAQTCNSSYSALGMCPQPDW